MGYPLRGVDERVVDGLTAYAAATGDRESAEAGRLLYRELSNVIDPWIGPYDECRLAFLSVLIRPDLRARCLVIVLTTGVLVAYRPGPFRGAETSFTPVPTITEVRQERGEPASVRGAHLLVIAGSPELTLALPLDWPDTAAGVVRAAIDAAAGTGGQPGHGLPSPVPFPRQADPTQHAGYAQQPGYHDPGSGAYPAQPDPRMAPWTPPRNSGTSTGAIVGIAVALIAVIATVLFLKRGAANDTAESPGPTATSEAVAAGSTAPVVGASGPPPVATSSPPPVVPRVQYWVDTFEDAPGYSTPGGPIQTGILYEGTHYVYCKVWGPWVGRSSTVYNHWWLLTDLDSGSPRTNQYVSAYYLSHWGNDEAKDNAGTVIPDC